MTCVDVNDLRANSLFKDTKFLMNNSVEVQFMLYFLLYSVILLNEALSPASPKYKLLCFITAKKICKEKNALGFHQDRCCHLVLCLRLIPFHWAVERDTWARQLLCWRSKTVIGTVCLWEHFKSEREGKKHKMPRLRDLDRWETRPHQQIRKQSSEKVLKMSS
jgi:hypothetical protein